MKRKVLWAIGVGAMIAGTIDILMACLQEGWDIPLYIAAGLLGRQAIHGGAAIYVLGVFLHFLIVCSWATVYYLASRRLRFMIAYPLLSGLNFDAWVELFMNLIVLPLSGLHANGPFILRYLLEGLASHMVIIGLPIAYSVRRFAR